MSEHDDKPVVLQINDANSWRGGEQQMVYLLRGLVARGFRAEAVCQPDSPAAERARAAGATVHEVKMRCEVDLAAAWQIARLARERGSDILHTHTAHAHTIAWLAKNICRAPSALIAHRRIEFAPGRGPFSAIKYRKGVDAYIAVSERVRDRVIEAGVAPERVLVVNSVTDPDRFTEPRGNPGLRADLGVPEDAFVVGNVGYLVPHKDQATLIEAARIASADVPNLWVIIVGPGPLEDDLRAQAQAAGLADRIIFAGYSDDVPAFTRAFDVFCLSSTEEGIPGTLLEAMAGRCPVIATDAAGVREAVVEGECGYVVPIKDAAGLAAGIVRYAKDPELARRMGEAARVRVETQFNPDVLTERTIDVYRRVLAAL